MIFELDHSLIVFPKPELAEEDGLLAVGGDLSAERLQLAYSLGIFPWYSDETPILWYSPHERFVLFPHKVKISKSTRQFINRKTYQVTENQAFEEVIRHCATVVRSDQAGTWITDDMQKAYITLHNNGIAHSVEVWQDTTLVGGLYGIKSGNVFCGESMFNKASNASKIALIWLCQHKNYSLIDCQFHTEHLESMGAEFMDREEYERLLRG